jgi:hypothetical protein
MRIITLARVPTPEPTDVADVASVLLEDHARTRNLLHRAEFFTRSSASSEAIVAIAQRVSLYFRYWHPLHELDEEQLVVPALLAHAPDVATRQVGERMIESHQNLDRDRNHSVRVWETLSCAPYDIEALREELRAATRALTRHVNEHSAWEEREFFPRVRRYVPREVHERLLRVMRLRRGVTANAA